MKFLVTGDWHITNTNPIHRIDDYEQTVFNKIEWLLSTAKKHDCTAVFQPGDLTDKYSLPDYLIRRYIMLFLKYGIDIITIPGQHDLRYHINKIDNTAFGILNAAFTKLAGESPIEIGHNVDVYGAGWNREIPRIKNPKMINILLIHKMVIKKNKLWAEQKDYILSKTLATQYGFSIVICGDNHNSFIYDEGEEILFNCGSIMRSTKAQMKHMPLCFILDTEKLSYQPLGVQIQPIEQVMKVDSIIEEKDLNEELNSFVESFQTSAKSKGEISGLDFISNLNDIIEDKKIIIDDEEIIIDDSIIKFIEQIMEGINGY